MKMMNDFGWTNLWFILYKAVNHCSLIFSLIDEKDGLYNPMEPFHCHSLKLFYFSAQSPVTQIRDNLKACASSGGDINQCLRDLAIAIKPYMTSGVPELGIPKADPLYLDKISFDLKNPIIDVHVDFSDNFVTGKIENDSIFLS